MAMDLFRSILTWTSILAFLGTCNAVMFHLKNDETRCLSEELDVNELVYGSYEILAKPEKARFEIVIKNSNEDVALKRDDVQSGSKFAFTTNDSDYYRFCITMISEEPQQGESAELSVDFRGGNEGVLDTNALTDEQVSRLEYNLDRIHMITDSMIKDFAHLKKRNRELQDTNESTNRRMFYQAITCIIALLALTIWQIVYMRAFFKVRKLIH